MLLPWLIPVLVLVVSSLYFPFHSNSQVLGSNVLLLTAHPDDECLFFAPTVLALRGTHRQVYSLTLSVGNADGFGETRKDELNRSLDVMGIDHDKRWIVDHPMLQDNITLQWDPSVIAVVMAPFVVNNHIDTILTFDKRGVTSHPNHYALPFGAWHLADTLRSNAIVPRVFNLVTVPLLPKYAGALASFSSRLSIVSERVLGHKDRKQWTIFISGFKEYMTAVQAMREHTSQLAWFRYLYLTFSRYMWVNEWVQVEV